jgi:hypothetical protein
LGELAADVPTPSFNQNCIGGWRVWKLMDEKMIHDFVKATVTGDQAEALCLAERCPHGCGRRLMLFPCSEHNEQCYVCSNLSCDGGCFDVDGKAKPYAEDGGFGN